jgi:phosphatidylserine/phosphatidylglycerophosphate/cardiolipin synthase-like enzyme
MAARPADRDRLVVLPADRRRAVLDVIAGARRRLLLTVFRCDDRRVIEALTAAARRGVRIEALITRRARGSRSALRLLRMLFEQLGIHVRRPADAGQKYHAKFLVADGKISLVGSLNYTRRCFRSTFDVLAVSRDPSLARALTALFESDCGDRREAPATWPERLIVAPGHARPRLRQAIESARLRVRIIDNRLTDPHLVGLLHERARGGLDVRLLTGARVAGLSAHGRLLLIDDRVAIVGSPALAPAHLDRRREVAVAVADAAAVRPLVQFFDAAEAAERTRPRLPDAMRPVA